MVLVLSILITCAAQCNLCNFTNLTIFCFLIKVSNSAFVFLLHVPSMSCVGPYICAVRAESVNILQVNLRL